MKMRNFLTLLLILGVLFVACNDDDDDDDNNFGTETYFIEDEIDNSSLTGALDVPEFTGESYTLDGTDLVDGAIVEERVINLSGYIPSTFAREMEVMEEPSRINLHAYGGTCMSPENGNVDSTFTIDFTQTVGVSYTTQGIMCTGDRGFDVNIYDAAGNIVWTRQYHQGIGMDIDTSWGTKTLTPGTYRFHANSITGTHCYAQLTYTPGSTTTLGSTLVVYHNGHLYPICDAEPGTYYDYSIDLHRGNNTIRVLVIGNFDQSAQQDLENILGASDVINITCNTDEIAIRCVLTWSTDDTDVDLHFIAPGGTYGQYTDCYFGNMTPNWGDSTETLDNPILDTDELYGYGPETMVIPSPQDGLYTVLVHYFSDHGYGNSPARVQVTINESDTRSFGPNNLSDGEKWIVTGVNVSNGIATFASPPDSSEIIPSYPAARVLTKN